MFFCAVQAGARVSTRPIGALAPLGGLCSKLLKTFLSKLIVPFVFERRVSNSFEQTLPIRIFRAGVGGPARPVRASRQPGKLSRKGCSNLPKTFLSKVKAKFGAFANNLSGKSFWGCGWPGLAPEPAPAWKTFLGRVCSKLVQVFLLFVFEESSKQFRADQEFSGFRSDQCGLDWPGPAPAQNAHKSLTYSKAKFEAWLEQLQT